MKLSIPGNNKPLKYVSQAREKAAALVKEAEQKAAAIVEQAKLDAGQYTARGQQALAQSARDLIITVGAGVEKVFRPTGERRRGFRPRPSKT